MCVVKKQKPTHTKPKTQNPKPNAKLHRLMIHSFIQSIKRIINSAFFFFSFALSLLCYFCVWPTKLDEAEADDAVDSTNT